MNKLEETLHPTNLLAKLRLPAQDLAKLSFAGSKAGKVASWVNSLKATQVNQTSSQLYRNIPELSRLKTDFTSRLDMLEAVRPTVQHCIIGLSKNFLQQPVILPEPAQKSAIVAQSLQKAMLDGYTQCIVSICQQNKIKPAIKEALAIALHRAITGIGLLFLRNYQLYTQTPNGLWQRLNTLYLIAEFYDLLNTPVMDPLLYFSRSTKVQAAYLRILMLATAKSNQLNQTDVSLCYQTFETWSNHVKTHPELTGEDNNFYAINLIADSPPVYKSKLSKEEQIAVLELDFGLLLGQLSKQSGEAAEVIGDANTIKVLKDFPTQLLEHLLNNWGNIAQRKQERKTAQMMADACMGLVDCHYFISGGQSFEDFVGQEGDTSSVFGRVKNAMPTGLTPLEAKNVNSATPDRPSYKVSLQNVSAGGYCLLWKGEVPTRLQAGELIGIKEMGKRSWTLGVVRWIRQLKQASQLGVQTLAIQARPYALARVYDMGGYSEYMRAIQLPPSKITNIPSSLVTAAVPFTDQDKVRAFDGDAVTNLKLDRKIFSTGNMQQFTYRPIDGAAQTTTESNKPKPSHFDSSWE